MNKKAILKKVSTILMVVCFVFVAAMAFWCYERYQAAKQSLKVLDSQKLSLSRLQTEIDNTRSSVAALKADQEEFKKLLFNDRDVPAFLDGLSLSAGKAKVHIIDMKTQRFSQITIPKEMENANKAEQDRALGDPDDAPKKDPKFEFKNLLTLAAMPIHIKLHGSFKDIVKFLNSMENYRQLLTVSNVEITRNTYPQLDCDFILKIYSLELLKDIKA